MTLYIFTEEPSMKAAIQGLLPRVVNDPRSIKIISFDGVGNMETALPRQLRALSGDEDAVVLILRDNDNGVCTDHKRKFARMVVDAGLTGRAKVRIVCQMLESWFIGDTAALKGSGHFKVRPVPKRLTTCDPDMLTNPKKDLRALRDGYNEISGAKAIAPHLNVSANRSASFRHTIQAIRDLTYAQGDHP